MAEKTFVSNSSLGVVATCETKFVLSYVLGYVAESDSAITTAGSAAHLAWAAYFRGNTPKTALQIFRDAYEPFAEDPDHFVEERLSFENVFLSLQQWFNRNPRSRLPWNTDPELVEIPIEMPLDEHGDIILISVLDLLPEAKDEDTHLVVDNKTTRAMTDWFERKFIMGSQITGYIAASRHYLEDPTINRAYINGLVLKKLNRSRTKCTMPAHRGMYREDCWPDHVEMRILGPYERTVEQIEDWHRTALRLAKRFGMYFDQFGGNGGKITQKQMNMLKTEGSFTDACRFCPYEKWCAFGRNVHTLDGMFERREKAGLRSGVVDEDSQ